MNAGPLRRDWSLHLMPEGLTLATNIDDWCLGTCPRERTVTRGLSSALSIEDGLVQCNVISLDAHDRCLHFTQIAVTMIKLIEVHATHLSSMVFLCATSDMFPTPPPIVVPVCAASLTYLPKQEEIRKVCGSADEVARVGDASIFYQQRLHPQGGQVLPHFLEIGAIVQVAKGFRSPMHLMRMRIDDEYIAAGAYHATQFVEDGARTHDVMQQHMAHRNIDGASRQRQFLGHPLFEGNMLVSGLGHLLPGPYEHSRRTIHADDVPHQWSYHTRKVTSACTRVEHGHILVPGKEPGEPFLQGSLISTRNILIPGGSDPIKIGSLLGFEMAQLLLWRGSQIEAKQGIKMFKNLFVG